MGSAKAKKTGGGAELIAGGTLGLLAVGEAAVGVAVCPFCVIAAPILIGLGAAKKIRGRMRV